MTSDPRVPSETQWRQERPQWCPHIDCGFIFREMDAACCGKLPQPEPHDGDFNTHRFCLNGAADNGGVFDLQVNTSDLWWFRRLFDAIDGKRSAEIDKWGIDKSTGTPILIYDQCSVIQDEQAYLVMRALELAPAPGPRARQRGNDERLSQRPRQSP